MNDEIENKDIRYIGAVHRLTLKPGDKVILTAPDHLSAQMRVRLKDYLAREFAGHQVLVLEGGLKLDGGLKIGVLVAEPE